MPYNFLKSRDFSVENLNGDGHSGGSRESRIDREVFDKEESKNIL